MMKSSRFEEDVNVEEDTIKDVRNPFRLTKKIKQLNTEYLETLEIFLSMKERILINQ